ncbi:MAG: hypothetical protein GXO74_14580 [Calditrichaeota bacterium]|nr:hypothetical protein [Calditrichota bacterium]
MSSTFEDTKITSFQPKMEKDSETKEAFFKMIFKGEAKLDNSLQITDLFAGFRKRLINVKFSAYDTYGGEIQFQDASIEDFTVKNKIERVGQGKDADRIPVEYVFFTMAVKMDVEGNFLKEMYSIFHRTVRMEIEFIE